MTWKELFKDNKVSDSVAKTALFRFISKDGFWSYVHRIYHIYEDVDSSNYHVQEIDSFNNEVISNFYCCKDLDISTWDLFVSKQDLTEYMKNYSISQLEAAQKKILELKFIIKDNQDFQNDPSKAKVIKSV